MELIDLSWLPGKTQTPDVLADEREGSDTHVLGTLIYEKLDKDRFQWDSRRWRGRTKR